VFRPGNKLFLGVGAQATPGANILENVDVYSVDVPPTLTNASFTNLSLSSRRSGPWPSSRECPLSTNRVAPDAAAARPAQARTCAHPARLGSAARHGAGGRRRARAAQTVLANIKSLEDWEFVNGWAWLLGAALGRQQCPIEL
jgi:hypothetical protein